MAPIIPTDFNLAKFRYNNFDCTVTAAQADDVENPQLWTNVAAQLSQGDEIRAITDDYSRRQVLLVTFVSGTNVRVVKVEDTQLEVTAGDDVDDGPVIVSRRGPKGWCLVDKVTGDIIMEKLPSKADAIKQADEYRKILES